MSDRPAASVSLDLDNLWAYQKTHGDAGWESFPSYLDAFVPLVLDALDDAGARITFFLVGQDVVLERNHAALRSIVARGHEVGNHSFSHDQAIERMDHERLRREVLDAHEAIAHVTGSAPRGYRGPGFSWNLELLETLAEAGYLYDASTLPTWIGPLARLYYFRGASAAQRERYGKLFGGFRDGLRPVKPYRWRLAGGRSLLEVPVTTIPGLRTPFHLSYLLYLGRLSTGLMTGYLEAALRLCRLTGTEPSFLLHPLDLLGPELAPDLKFFPGMDLASERKRATFRLVLTTIARRFRLVTMADHAAEILERHPPLRDAGGALPGAAA